MRRSLVALAGVLVAAIAIYWFGVRDSSVEAQLQPLDPAAQIGVGEEAIVVNSKGELLRWLAPPQRLHLPKLPLEKPPKGDRVKGRMLEQVKVLAAVPPPLRRFLAGSRYGESGVDVELTSGIELRFGDASQIDRKWKAAATVLADPELTALDYVNVTSPQRPAFDGEGHALPSLP